MCMQPGHGIFISRAVELQMSPAICINRTASRASARIPQWSPPRAERNDGGEEAGNITRTYSARAPQAPGRRAGS